MVEKHGSDVVQVAVQSEQTFPGLQRPNLDGVVVTTRHENRLRWMEINSSDRTIVLFKPVDQGSHPVIPKLNRRGVESNQDPRSFWVESNTLCP
ncbi:hypothetical protein OGAPHI_002252 [Ogataea philodendri]|uniref:Uncharacterized protein n=1 Tax=Ogataea philodendri TaxID=1378263 RepID=A0A9P8PA53_9ASCO|nr:uncharacterized protein OGAPHI_002252 [Ogataea philodendri]KAH3668498.1 hypothetical protein OGAPHI_002252 [Ogataea philodendri]